MWNRISIASVVTVLTIGLAGCDSHGSDSNAPANPAPPTNNSQTTATETGTATPPAQPAQEQPQVLTRGPVHESFAEPVDSQTAAGVTASSQPPENVNETPPDDQPAGSVWVPGYWGWDTDQSRYIWVSGCWRVAPPNMYWVPGYWAQVGNSWQWVAGFWAPSTVQEMEYLPDPPAVADLTAPGAPPTADSIWVPPCPYWADGQYVTRAGYWLPAQQNWVWEPSHYVWTPRGHVFVRGYWDYAIDHRGVLFAPVYFDPSAHVAGGFAFTPSICLDMDGLTANLFAFPRYSHFYFGDYYDDSYVSIGIYPWFDCDRLHTWYDADFEHDRWQFGRSNPKWEDGLRHDFDTRRADKSLRPPRTYKELQTRLAKAPEAQRRGMDVARPLKNVVEAKGGAMKFEAVSPESRKQMVKQNSDVDKFRQERTRWESTPAGARTPASPTRVEHNPPAAVSPSENRPERTPPAEHNPEPTPPAQVRPEPTPPVQGRPEPTPPAQGRPEPAPPAENRPTQSDRWQVPYRPYGDQAAPPGGGNNRGVPDRPADEERHDSGKQAPPPKR